MGESGKVILIIDKSYKGSMYTTDYQIIKLQLKNWQIVPRVSHRDDNCTIYLFANNSFICQILY